jgi:hypothetical protein
LQASQIAAADARARFRQAESLPTRIRYPFNTAQGRLSEEKVKFFEKFFFQIETSIISRKKP